MTPDEERNRRLIVITFFLNAAVTTLLVLALQAKQDANRERVNEKVGAALVKANKLVADGFYHAQHRLVTSQRIGCARTVKDRQESIASLQAAIKADDLIAKDPFQSKVTRDARAAQVAADRVALAGRMARVPPAFSCARAYP